MQLASAVSMLKLERGCADCGYAEDPAALGFDHVGDDKVEEIGHMVWRRRPIEDILAEAEKCEVVCANCRAVRTAERRR